MEKKVSSNKAVKDRQHLPEQLLSSPLIGSKANHFSDEISHKLNVEINVWKLPSTTTRPYLVVLGQLSLGLAGLGL